VYVAPNAPQVLYLVATPGGQTSAVLHRSDNRGQSWVALPRNPIRSATTDRAARRLLVIHPSDPRTAYALEEAVVSKTVDGGQTWKPLSLQVRATGLVIDRSKPDHVYAWYPMRNSIDGEILMRSLDGGTTWSGAGYMPRTFYDRDAPLPALAIDNDSRLLVRDIDGFMMQSTDDGATWTRPLTFGKGHPFAFASSAPKTLYTVMDASSVTIIKTTDGDSWNQTGSVGGAVQLLGAGRSEGSFFVETRVGVARTLDEGRTWSVPVPDARGLFFAVSAAASGTLYQIKNNGVVRSTDGGQTFTARTGIPPTGAQLIKAVAADTEQTRTLYSSWLLTNLNDEAGFRSTDGGETWAPWPVRATEDAKDRGFIELASPRARPSTIYANVQYGLRKTIDGGVTWTKVFAEPVWAMAVAPSDGDVVFVKHVVVPGAGLKVKKTIDGGKTWTDVNIDAFNPYALEGITIDPVDPKVVYLGLSLSEGAAVARSNDGGVTWTKLGAGLPPARSLAIAPTRPSTLYFGSYGGAIHRSLDSGLTWTRIDRRTDGDSAFPTVDPMDPRTVYVLLKSDSNTSVYSGRLLRTVTGGE
jgi:photosystem II stability/assembly factor-like uncharacterized protein